MELVPGGNLREVFMQHNTQFSEFTVHHIMQQMLDTLKHLHNQKHIVHRDIKPENIMVLKDRVGEEQKIDIKIVDFGLATVKDVDENLAKGGMGSKYYMAPELVQSVDAGHDFKVDIWALGVLCFQLFSNDMLPWLAECDEDIETEELERRICACEIHWEHFDGEGLEDAKDFIKKCLTVDPVKRPNAAKLKTSKFINKREPSRATRPILNQAIQNTIEYSKLNLFQKRIFYMISSIATMGETYQQ